MSEPERECPLGFCDGSGLRYWATRDAMGGRVEEVSVCPACGSRDEEPEK